ncbi:MAG: hypothetical protein ACTHL3_04240 [Candidatus Nitrosocosmicus sp.]
MNNSIKLYQNNKNKVGSASKSNYDASHEDINYLNFLVILVAFIKRELKLW